MEMFATTETNACAESARRRLRELVEKQDHVESGPRRLAQVLTGLLDSRLTCKVCEEAPAAYVDDEISGVDVARKYPDVKRHLDLCEDCASIAITQEYNEETPGGSCAAPTSGEPGAGDGDAASTGTNFCQKIH